MILTPVMEATPGNPLAAKPWNAHKNGEVVVPAGGETGGPRCLAEVY